MKRLFGPVFLTAVLLLSGGCHWGTPSAGEAAQEESQQQAQEQPTGRYVAATETQPAPAEAEVSEGTPSQPGQFKRVREPAVAGMFYPAHKDDLAKAVDGYLAKAKPVELGTVRGLVVPHAGYEFSGPVAAVAYRQLKGQSFDTVIVMGPSHTALFRGASIPDTDAYATPLGTIPLSPRAAKLGKLAPFCVNPECEVRRPQQWRRTPKELPPFGQETPHTFEHSVEVQLPFLQRTLGSFKLVPIVFGNVDPKAAAKVLAGQVDDKTLVVASSDLSHYYPYEKAKDLDKTCIEAIRRMDFDWMAQQEACGKLPILTLMHVAKKKGWKPVLLDYRNSGDTSGEKSRGVVGYAAIAFVEADHATAGKPDGAARAELTPQDKDFLLKLARKTVEQSVRGEGEPELKEAEVPERLRAPGACFVTLTEGGRLRGCIGHIFPREPLYKSAIDNSMRAALSDFRFSSVKRDELGKIQIEVSILTIPRPLEFKSPEDLLQKLRPKVDGVVLQVGRSGATYLPQVWEQLPDKKEFLDHLAKKAGLDADAWRKPEARVLTYQVVAFHE
jgi:AmmeMemoRadiSam system protein B/AmmeMemoRadiSam system protein A